MERSIKGDYIGFTFGDVHSSELGLVRVSDGSRYNTDLLPPLEDKVGQVAGRDGEVLFGTNYKAKEIKVPVAFDNMTEESFRRLTQLLADKKPKSLWFDESPYKEWIVKSANVQDFKWVCFDESHNGKEKRIYKGEGTLVFKCRNPYAQSRVTYLDEIVPYVYVKEGHKIIKKMSENKSIYEEYWIWSKATKKREFIIEDKFPLRKLTDQEKGTGNFLYFDNTNKWLYHEDSKKYLYIEDDKIFFYTYNEVEIDDSITECSIRKLKIFKDKEGQIDSDWEEIENDTKFYIKKVFLSEEEYKLKEQKNILELLNTKIYRDRECTELAYEGFLCEPAPTYTIFQIHGTVYWGTKHHKYFPVSIIIPKNFVASLQNNYNFKEWKEASGLKYSFDFRDGFSQSKQNEFSNKYNIPTGHYVELHNPGDIETNMLLKCNNTVVTNEDKDCLLQLYKIVKNSNDEEKIFLGEILFTRPLSTTSLDFIIDTKLKMLKKIEENGVERVFNNNIKNGDFFKLPACQENEYLLLISNFSMLPYSQTNNKISYKHYYYV